MAETNQNVAFKHATNETVAEEAAQHFTKSLHEELKKKMKGCDAPTARVEIVMLLLN